MAADSKKRHPIKDFTNHRQKRARVGVDEIAWKEVTLPDRLDDYEGFFGLEEVENVEVVKDKDGSKLELRVVQVKQEHHSNGAPSRAGPKVEESVKPCDEETWEGFAEEREVDTHKGETRKSKKQKRKQDNQKSQSAYATSTSVNEFGDLEIDPRDAGVDVSAWKTLELSGATLSSLSRLGFKKPTQIQTLSIPEILKGHDVIGKASTGSGKTLAFGIPILEHFLKSTSCQESVPSSGEETPRKPPTAFILSPTRELAHQLDAHLKALCSNLHSDSPFTATLTGGLSIQKQLRLLSKADIIIGTPGRLWEVLSQGKGLVEWLQKTKFLVLDEADRLLSDGHFKEVDEILNVLTRVDDNGEGEEDGLTTRATKTDRQTLVFSATFHKELQQKLANKAKTWSQKIATKAEPLEYLLQKLNFREAHPKFIDANPAHQMASGLTEYLTECGGTEKDHYLYALLIQNPRKRILVFTNSVSAVRRLTPFLQNLALPAYALHSQMPQKARLRSIERFTGPNTSGSILIATDVAARGLDINDIDLVIHYHLPLAADTYVHRSGRTARATQSGLSVLLCAPEDVAGVRRLVAKVHAQKGDADARTTNYIHSLELDRRLIARLKPRVSLAKKLADSSLAKEKMAHEKDWLKTAAEDLGVDYDSEEFDAAEGGKKGRGNGRKKAAREARSVDASELAAMRAELKGLLAQRVNVGVSERYLTNGAIDIDELLAGDKGEFLGKPETMGLSSG